MLVYRGVAVFEGGVPMRMNSVRMLWGSGVRAGLYPLSATEAYWFTTLNCNSVRSISPGSLVACYSYCPKC